LGKVGKFLAVLTVPKLAISVALAISMLFVGGIDGATAKVTQINDNTVTITEMILTDDLNCFLKLEINPLAEEIRIIINSSGGMSDVAKVIVDETDKYKRKGYKIITEIYSHAGSAAAIIFLMGDERIMHSTAYIYFHDSGFADPTRNYKDVTDKVCAEDPFMCKTLAVDNHYMHSIFAKVTGCSVKEAKKLFNGREGRYFTAKEAMEHGIANKLLP
jgi:ATP-dependent protease ClpP protease subunit